MQLRKLFLGAGLIYAIYLTSSIYLEKIYSSLYLSSINGQYQHFRYPSMLVYVESLFCAFLGYVRGWVTDQTKNPVPHHTQILLGFLYTVHIVAANFALLYISYPSQVVGMNFVGVYFSRVLSKKQKLKKQKIFLAMIATFGAISYNIMKSESKQSEAHLDPSKYWIGYLFVVLAIFSDAFFLDTQAYAKQRYRPTANNLLTSANFYTSLFCIIISILKGTFIQEIDFCLSHPSVNIDILVISILQAFGQVTIYYVIINFRQHIFPLIAMTRKIITIVLSILIFNHQINLLQVISLIVVFGALSFEVLDEFSSNNNLIFEVKYIRQKPSKSMKSN